MTDRPIIFSGPMVRAILEGRKTQTRLALKPQPVASRFNGLVVEQMRDGVYRPVAPPYAPGDRLWARETWQQFFFSQDGDRAWPPEKIVCPAQMAEIGEDAYRVAPPQIVYRESERARQWFPKGPWRSSSVMPRWASRLTLVVEAVKVERLQDISEDDAIAEGVGLVREINAAGDGWIWSDPRKGFSSLWNSINAKRPGCAWADNPWVAAITFRVEASK